MRCGEGWTLYVASRNHRRYGCGNTQTCVYTPLNDRQNPVLAVSQLFLKGEGE